MSKYVRIKDWQNSLLPLNLLHSPTLAFSSSPCSLWIADAGINGPAPSTAAAITIILFQNDHLCLGTYNLKFYRIV